MTKIHYKKFVLFFITIFFLSPINYSAIASVEFRQGTPIRDAEIEAYLHEYLDPLFRVAGLDHKDIHLYIIVDKTINAAASFNNTLLINTGFILKTTSPDEIAGVLAHETGHIAGRHMVRQVAAMENMGKRSLLGIAGGILLGALTGRADVGMAVAMGSNISSIYGYLHYSQGEESAADQSALKYLHTLCWPTKGLETFFDKLLAQELLSSNLRDPYCSTHPMTWDRVAAIKNKSPQLCKGKMNALFYIHYNRMKIKLEAYMDFPETVLEKYKDLNSENDLYARSIAYYRQANYEEALTIIEKLIQDFPNNPYYYEFKGQILFDHEKTQESLTAYKQSLKLYSKSVLQYLNVIKVLIKTDKLTNMKECLPLLDKAQKLEPHNMEVWHYYAIVHGRLGNMKAMTLALTEKAVLAHEWKEAKTQLLRATHFHKGDKKPSQKLQDLKLVIDRELNEETQTESYN